MPVWGAVISKSQVADLVAYIRAGLPKRRSTRDPVPGPARPGARSGRPPRSYVRYGCINCHGAERRSAACRTRSRRTRRSRRSPARTSAKSSTRDSKIIDFIRSGSVIGKQPIASMPHWGGIIPDRNLRALVAYLKTLK